MSKFIKFDDGTPVLGNGTATAVSLNNPNTDLRNPGEKKMGEVLEFMNEYREKPRNAAAPITVDLNTEAPFLIVLSQNGGFFPNSPDYFQPKQFLGNVNTFRLNNVTSLYLVYGASWYGDGFPNTTTLPSSDFEMDAYITLCFFDYNLTSGIDFEPLVNIKLDNKVKVDTGGFVDFKQPAKAIDLLDTIDFREENNFGQPSFQDTNDFNVRNKITKGQLETLLGDNNKVVSAAIAVDRTGVTGNNATFLNNNASVFIMTATLSLRYFGLLGSYTPVSS